MIFWKLAYLISQLRTGFRQNLLRLKTCPQGVLQAQEEKSRFWIFTTSNFACLWKWPLNEYDGSNSLRNRFQIFLPTRSFFFVEYTIYKRYCEIVGLWKNRRPFQKDFDPKLSWRFVFLVSTNFAFRSNSRLKTFWFILFHFIFDVFCNLSRW